MTPLFRNNGILLVRNGVLAGDVNCCCPSPSPALYCLLPTRYAFIDYTDCETHIYDGTLAIFPSQLTNAPVESGCEIVENLAVGNVITELPRPPVGLGAYWAEPGAGPFPFGLPIVWKTRGYRSDTNPRKIGLFVIYDHPFPLPRWLALETWTVTYNACAGGNWWNDYNPIGTYLDPYCNEPLKPKNNRTTVPEHFANEFIAHAEGVCGAWTWEWSNMANWQGTNSTVSWELKLPDITINTSIVGVVASNAIGVASVGALDISGYVKIKIDAVGPTNITGGILRIFDNHPIAGCGPFNCNNLGHIVSVGAVTFLSNGYNNGRIECQDIVTFKNTSSNRWEVFGDDIIFMDLSKCFGDSELNATNILFKDDSSNVSSLANNITIYRCNTLTFNNNAKNLAIMSDGAASKICEVYLLGDSVNDGSIFNLGRVFAINDTGSPKNQGTIETKINCEFGGFGPGIALNADGAVIRAQNFVFKKDSINNGLLSCWGTFPTVAFSSNALNNGSITAPGLNPIAGWFEIEFSDNAKNDGLINGLNDDIPTFPNKITFKNDAKNLAGGTITYAIGPNTANDYNIEFKNQSENLGTINGNVIFNDSSINYGTVNGNAVFNNSACNFGTVNGTIICNTPCC